ncbi:MAG: hypothetical protein ACRDZQ_04970, partial [Acidimicrobiales bacterium]
FYSMPIFFLCLLLIAAFAIQFHVLPPEAPQFTNALSILAHPRGLILPVAERRGPRGSPSEPSSSATCCATP